MGTLVGHVFLGPLYSVLGMWYIIQATRRYCRCSLKGRQFVSTIAYPADFLPSCLRNIPIDSLTKLMITVIYLPVELTYSYLKYDGAHMLTKQHSTIASALVVASVSELLVHYKLPVPRDLDYVGNACFFLVETLTIYWHLHGSPLEYRVHVFFLMSIVMGLVAVLAEARAKHHVTMPVLRGTVFILKGTWLAQVGVMLYNPLDLGWDQTDEASVHLSGIVFLWHLLADLVVAMATSTITAMAFFKAVGKSSEPSARLKDYKYTTALCVDDEGADQPMLKMSNLNGKFS